MINHADNSLRRGVVFIYEAASLLGELSPDFAAPGQGFDPNKETGSAMAGVCIVLTQRAANLRGDRAPRCTMQFLAGFVQTDRGTLRIIGARIDL
jgi:hypothetical protein